MLSVEQWKENTIRLTYIHKSCTIVITLKIKAGTNLFYIFEVFQLKSNLIPKDFFAAGRKTSSVFVVLNDIDWRNYNYELNLCGHIK